MGGNQSLAGVRPLDGVPIAAKDNLLARGYTKNDIWGVTRNPLDPRLTPGGSCGGTAAALAASIVDFAVGTDGGSATRRSAAHCGLVGLKPSIGYIPRDMVHFRVLTHALASPAPDDSRSYLRQLPLLETGRRLRISWFDGFDGHPVDPDIRAACAFAAEIPGRMGHGIERVTPFFPLTLVGHLQRQITDAALAAAHPDFARTAPPEYMAQAVSGAALGVAGVMQILADIGKFRAMTGHWFVGHDVLLTPAAAAQAWPVEKEYPALIDGQPAGPRGHAVFTDWVNVCGHPALSIPSGAHTAGLPVGIQLVGAFGADELLLDLGAC